MGLLVFQIPMPHVHLVCGREDRYRDGSQIVDGQLVRGVAVTVTCVVARVVGGDGRLT